MIVTDKPTDPPDTDLYDPRPYDQEPTADTLASRYPPWTWIEGERNFYGEPIIDAGHFMGVHYPALVPPVAGLPPRCSCNWTRWRTEGGRWFELTEHIEEMGGFGSMTRPATVA